MYLVPILKRITFAAVLAVLAVSPVVFPKTPRAEGLGRRVEHLRPEMRREYGSLQYLLTAGELEEFWALNSNSARRRWIREYWELNDPKFTSTANEMRAVHDLRVSYADSVFTIPKWPGWDQRGELTIRYGLPDSRTIIPVKVSPNGVIPPTEIWYYAAHDMFVRLEDIYGSGEYTYTLGSVDGPPSRRIRSFKTSAAIDAIINQGGNNILLGLDKGAKRRREQFTKRLLAFEDVRRDIPSTYPYNFSSGQLPFYFGVDCFRGGEAVDRVEVNVEFQTDIKTKAGDEGDDTKTYLTTAMFWDTDRNVVDRRQQKMEISVASTARDSSWLMPVQLLFSLPPAFYHVAVTVEEKNSRRFTSYRALVTCEDFATGLAISDILFARKISEAATTSPFNRGALEVIPHPGCRYRVADAVPVYFEVYNLEVDRRGLSSYTVEYRIVPHEAEKRRLLDLIVGERTPVEVSSTFRMSSQGAQDVVRLAIRVDNLWEGNFKFQVTITDEISLEQVSRQTVFHIVE